MPRWEKGGQEEEGLGKEIEDLQGNLSLHYNFT